ncbi:MAG TPA: MBL fold metallo-hydrolase [Vicinamibacterales bacterium]|nr:MBL fold metallo-hydrolase [Vicinamibacterales bacterium]
MREPRYPVSDHCDGRRFFNPHAHTARTPRELIRWWRTRQRVPWPERVPRRACAPPPDAVPPDRVAATFVGHATWLLRTASVSILTDPVFTSHAGPFGLIGPRRVRPPALDVASLPPIDLVLLSHNHYDHLQPSSLRALGRRFDPVFVTTLGLASMLRRLGLRRVVELDWWQTADLARPERVTCVPAQHFSARTPFDRDRTLWGGFVVSNAGKTLYFAGDTGYSPQFREIAQRVPSIDLALVPIGAYEPRWFMRPAHVNPDEAVRIHQDVAARTSFAMHFGTFHLTDEGIDDPVQALARAREAAGLAPETFRVIECGETALL